MSVFGLKSRWGVTQLALWSQVPSRFVLIRYKDLLTQLRRNYERDNGFLEKRLGPVLSL